MSPRRGRAVVLTGAVAGTLATAAMSAVVGGAQRTGFDAEQPPKRIVEHALDRLGADRPGRADDALAALAA